MRLSLILCCLALTACGSVPTAPEVSIAKPQEKIHLDPRVLEPCKKLIELPEKATFEDLLTVSLQNMGLYIDCKNRQDISIKLLKEAANIKE